MHDRWGIKSSAVSDVWLFVRFFDYKLFRRTRKIYFSIFDIIRYNFLGRIQNENNEFRKQSELLCMHTITLDFSTLTMKSYLLSKGNKIKLT